MAADSGGFKSAAQHLMEIDPPGALGPTVRRMLRWLKISGISLAILAMLAIFAALSVAREVLMPVGAAIVVGLIIGPIGDRGRKRGIPTAVTFTALVVGFLVAMYLVVILLQPIVQDLIATLPSISLRVLHLSERLQQALRELPFLQPSSAHAPAAATAPAAPDAVNLATRAVSVVTPALSQLLIFIFVLVLFLAGRSSIRQTMAFSFRKRESRLAMLKTLSSVENQLTDYFQVVTIINLVLGVLVAGSFWALGVPGAFSWGLMAFVLNYLPVVGPLLMKAALIVFGLIFASNLVEGAAPFVVFLCLSVVEANLVTPKVIGNRITMDPLLVFISVIFWTWLWGFAGAFLAMPLLAITSVIIDTYFHDKEPQLPG